MMMNDFPDSILVTGCGTGIGRACAIRLARSGSRIGVFDMSESGVESTTEEIERSGGIAIPLLGDVSTEEDVQAAVAAMEAQFGLVDAVVNNAGIIGPVVETSQLNIEDVHRVLDVNVVGTWLVMKCVIPGMVARGRGSIVNISSAIGLRGGPMQSMYSASKHAVIGLTRSTAHEYAGAGIRINAVCPGVIRTPALQGRIDSGDPAVGELLRAHPVGRFGTPEEVAETVAWLLSGSSSFTTGASLVVDGGFLA